MNGIFIIPTGIGCEIGIISGIYSIRNIVTDKIYIGSSVNIINRMQEHYRNLERNKHNNKHLQSSWDKHSKENFEFKLIELVGIKGELIEREQYWIDFYDSYRHGFNKTPRAYNSLGFRNTEEAKQRMFKLFKEIKERGNESPDFGKKASKETREKMSMSHRGKERSAKHSENLSIALKGHVVSDKTKEKISKSLKGRVSPKKGKNYK